MSDTDARVKDWINSCPSPPPLLRRPNLGCENSISARRSAASASPVLAWRSHVVRSFATSGRGKRFNQPQPQPEPRPGAVATVSPPSVDHHPDAYRYRELIDQAIMPGVTITTPHAMAVEVVLEGAEVLVNVSGPTEIRMFAPGGVPALWSPPTVRLELRSLPPSVASGRG